MAGKTYSFRFFDSNIWYLKILILYKHLKHIYKHNESSRFFIFMMWKVQMQCFKEIVVSQWSHKCHMPSNLPGIVHPHNNHPHQSTFQPSQNHRKILCLTMSTSSSASSHPSSHSSSNLDHDLPTMRDLNHIIRDRNFLPLVECRFQYGPQTTSQLLHFISLPQTIQQLESNLQPLFINLQDDERFQQQIQPVYRYYQQI